MTQRVALPYFGMDPLPWQRPALSAFTSWINQTPTGKATATATDNPNGLPLVIQAKIDTASGFYMPSALLKAAPTAPWTITVAVAGVANYASAGNYYYPLLLRNSSNDKAVAFAWAFTLNGSTVQTQAAVWHFTGVSTGQSATQSTAGPQDAGFPFPDYFGWFRIENDGTNLNFSISQEGVLFLPHPHTETLASFIGAVDQVGFGVDRLNQVGISFTPDAAIPLWSWVES